MWTNPPCLRLSSLTISGIPPFSNLLLKLHFPPTNAPGTAKGVAPLARLAVYKVLWGGGGVSSDLLAGIDQAVADGVNILSISLGVHEINLYESPLSIASFGAREKGVVVCFSAGNRGPSLRTIRYGIPWAVIVAAGTVDRWFAGTLTLGNGKKVTGWTKFPARAIVRNLPLVYNEASRCDSTELVEAPDNNIIICNTSIGNTEFDSIMGGLSGSNSRAVIVIAEDPKIFRSKKFPYPGTVITPREGQAVANYALSSACPTASIAFQQTILGKEPRAAPALSDFSSTKLRGHLEAGLDGPGSFDLSSRQSSNPRHNNW